MQTSHEIIRAAIFALACPFCGMLLLVGCGSTDRGAAPKTPSEKQSAEKATSEKTAAAENKESSKTPSNGNHDEKKISDKESISSENNARSEQNSSPAASEDSPQGKVLFDGKTLDGWTITKFGGEGEVRVEDGAILMEMGNPMSGITWTGEPPRENYEVTLEGMRVRESDFFCTTTFPVGKSPCSLVVGGWGGSVVGLSSVDGYDASENPTTKTMHFNQKQWYRVRIRVTEQMVQAWIDDREVVHQARAGHRFGIRYEVERSKPLGIAAWNTVGAVRNIRLRQLSEEEIAAGKEDSKDETEE